MDTQIARRSGRSTLSPGLRDSLPYYLSVERHNSGPLIFQLCRSAHNSQVWPSPFATSSICHRELFLLILVTLLPSVFVVQI
jgi:hypothetical protein